MDGRRVDWLKRKLCDLVLEAERVEEEALYPQDLVYRENWKHLQFRDDPKYLCYRGPELAVPPVPLMLLHPSLMRFSEDSRDSSNANMGWSDIEVAAKLCAMLSVGLDSDLSFKEALTRLLLDYLGTSFFPIITNKGDEDVASGTLTGVVWLMSPVVAIECRLDSDPYFQLLSLLHQLFSSSRPRERTSHVLGMLFTGTCFQVLAVVWDTTRSKLLAEPLTDYVCCIGPQLSTVPKVARFLSATRKFVEQYSRSEHLDVRTPWQIRDWRPSSLMDLQELVFLCDSHPCHGKVVVKFGLHYNAQAHKGWHKQQVAPELLEVEDVGCGWKMMVMEFLDPADGWRNAADYAIEIQQDRGGLERLQKLVRAAAESGHKSGFCHGDFRLENIMVKLDGSSIARVNAVDFEFSGEAGHDRYPCWLGNGIEWHAGAAFGSILQKEHDFHFVNGIA